MGPDVGFSALPVGHMHIMVVILCRVNAYAVMDIPVQCVTGPVLMGHTEQDAH